MARLEFPYFFHESLSFALFRTYGIPSIASLLHSTGRLTSPSYVDLRLADTTGLIADIMAQEYGSPEWTEGMARLNCIHAHYLDQGLISQDDMRYTLALFACEPVRWVARYEWRPMSEVERCACGVFWKALGDAMDISWDGLPTSKGDWTDGVHFLDELGAWADDYEAKYMLPTESTATVASQTLNALLELAPTVARPGLRNSVATLMDERLRRAVKVAAPPPWAAQLVIGGLTMRSYLLRYLVLPRLHWNRVETTQDKRKDGRKVFLTRYVRAPYYVEPTFWNRWGFGAWGKRLAGLPLPGGPDGAKYMPEGFTARTVGPAVGRARQDAMEDAVTLRAEGKARCPFSGMKPVA